MREAELREWMVAEGHSPSTQNTQATDARRLETHYGDLDEAFDEDEFEAIREALAYSKEDERAGRPNPAKFEIVGDLYKNLSHYRSTLGYYARFRKATDGVELSAEDIDKRIELFDDNGNAHWPVRQMDRSTGDIAFRIRGASNRTADAEKTTDILEVGRALFKEGRSVRVVRSNNGRRPYLAYGKQKLTSYKMAPEIAAALGMPPRGGVNETSSSFDQAALENLRQKFLAQCPGFEPEGFPGTCPQYLEVDAYKRDAVEKFASAVDAQTNSEDVALGAALLDILAGTDLLDWRSAKHLKEIRELHPGKIERAAAVLAETEDASETAIEQMVETIWPLLSEDQKSQPYSESRSIPTMLLALARPEDAVGINTDPLWNTYKALTGNAPWGNNPLTADEYSGVLTFAEDLFETFAEWGWRPRDLWDVRSFIWIVNEKPTTTETDNPTSSDTQTEQPMPKPTNLILYGPPGTGKTYLTALEAVQLCDGAAPDDRTELKARYDTLVEAGQIGFVTFHQSYAYEDFVEGLRPETRSDEGEDEGTGAGFRLEARHGIFREVCAIAQDARRNVGRRGGYNLEGRKFFKMSLGRAGSEDYIYDEAIEGNYIVLGWGGEVDWSDPRFGSWPEMLKRWKEDNPEATGNDPNVVQMWPFRSSMEVGDLVIVSSGNRHFRAIGEITQPYEFKPTDVREYNHRRSVRWLMVADEPLPVEMIYGKNFMMQSCYQLKSNRMKLEALSRLLPGNTPAADASPDQFVLIIDEINRANISKVFGELITLIEEDKRIGSANQTTVKLPYSGDVFGVPDNLHIVGTMNTADRSIALLDTALRRRFTFRELMPEPHLLEAAAARTGAPLPALLRTINERIEYLFDREHQIGHAYFINCKTLNDVHETMRHRIIPLLAEYFYEDWSKVALVLGDGEGEGRFLTRIKLDVPAGMQSDGFGEERYRWQVRSSFADDAYNDFG